MSLPRAQVRDGLSACVLERLAALLASTAPSTSTPVATSTSTSTSSSSGSDAKPPEAPPQATTTTLTPTPPAASSAEADSPSAKESEPEAKAEAKRESEVAALLVECERQASALDAVLEQCAADAGRHSLDSLLLTAEELIEVRATNPLLLLCRRVI